MKHIVPHFTAMKCLWRLGVRYEVMPFFCYIKSIRQRVTLPEFHIDHINLEAKILTVFEWAIKELLSLSFLCRHFAIEPYGVTGGFMLCDCDRKQMRCTLTALLFHYWTANVRIQTAYVQARVRDGSRGCVLLGLRMYTSLFLSSVCCFAW